MAEATGTRARTAAETGAVGAWSERVGITRIRPAEVVVKRIAGVSPRPMPVVWMKLFFKASSGADDFGDDYVTHAGFSELPDDAFVHDIIHADVVELTKRDGVVHMVALEFDDVLRAEDAPVLELEDEAGGNAGG